MHYISNPALKTAIFKPNNCANIAPDIHMADYWAGSVSGNAFRGSPGSKLDRVIGYPEVFHNFPFSHLSRRIAG